MDNTKRTKQERLDLLRKAIQETNKKNEMDTVHFANDEEDIKTVGFGIPEIDRILGGGIAYGKFTTIWGSPSSGKTTLAYYLTAEAQKQGKIVYYIALEQFDQDRAKQFGVDLDKLIIGKFPQAEQALDTIVKLAREGLVDVIILDSIQALSPKTEQEEKSGEQKSLDTDTMALLARKLSQFFRIAVDPVGRNNVAVFLIGQTRTNVGFIAFDQLSGGNALKHYSKVILHIRRGQKGDSPVEKIKEYYTEDGKEKYRTITKIVGFDTVIAIDKAQITGVEAEGTQIHIPFYFDSGFIKKEIIVPKSIDEHIEEEIQKSPELKKEYNKEVNKLSKKRGRPSKKDNTNEK